MSPYEPRSGDVKRSYNSSETPEHRRYAPRGVTILKTSHRTAGSILTAVQRSFKIWRYLTLLVTLAQGVT